MRQEPTRSSAPTYQAVVYTSLDGTPSQPLSRDVLSPSLRNAVKQGVTHTMRPRISRELSAEQRRGDAAAPHRLVLPEDALTNLSAPAAPSRLSAEELTTFTGAELPAAWGVTNSDLSTRHKHQWQQEDAQRRKLLGNGWDKVSRHSAGNEVRPFTSQPSKHLSVLDSMYLSWKSSQSNSRANTPLERRSTSSIYTSTPLEDGGASSACFKGASDAVQESPALDAQFAVWTFSNAGCSQDTPPAFASAPAGMASQLENAESLKASEVTSDHLHTNSRARRALQWS